MWSDNDTAVDLLGVAHLAGAVKRTVLDQRLLPVTVGIFGDWGSGKTSLASMVRAEAEKESGTFCISFNGWLFEGYEDAKTALIGSVLDDLIAKRGALEKAKDVATRLRQRINWFGVFRLLWKVGAPALGAGYKAGAIDHTSVAAAAVAGLSGISGEDVTGVVQDKPTKSEEPRKGIREFREDLQELLEKTGVKALVVFIDDLDRCLPDTVVETLEAVRLFLSTPRTAFVICADERLVRAAVRHRYPQEGEGGLDVAREYLEKLVQVPIRIPPLSRRDVRRYMNLLFAQVQFGNEFEAKVQGLMPWDARVDALSDQELIEKLAGTVTADLQESLALVAQVGDVLAVGLNGNPRQIKRFLNTMMLRMGMAQDRGVMLKRRILAKIMVLEYVKETRFRDLAEWQSGQLGKPAELRNLERVAGQRGATTGAQGARGKARAASEKVAMPPVEVGADVSQTDDPALKGWLDDPWLLEWLKSEPMLSAEDLSPYFYVSRERIGTIHIPGLRLSPSAQNLVSELLAGSKALRQRATDEARQLSPVEANAVFQAISERCRQTETLDGEDSPLTSLIGYVKVRPELSSELWQLLKQLPLSALGPGVTPRVAALKVDNPDVGVGVDGVLGAWANQDSNTMLAQAAKNMLERR